MSVNARTRIVLASMLKGTSLRPRPENHFLHSEPEFETTDPLVPLIPVPIPLLHMLLLRDSHDRSSSPIFIPPNASNFLVILSPTSTCFHRVLARLLKRIDSVSQLSTSIVSGALYCKLKTNNFIFAVC